MRGCKCSTRCKDKKCGCKKQNNKCWPWCSCVNCENVQDISEKEKALDELGDEELSFRQVSAYESDSMENITFEGEFNIAEEIMFDNENLD